MKMKLFNLFYLVTILSFGQTQLVKNVDKFVGVDIYENYYYLQNGSLFKSSLNNDYKNIEFGTPDSVDISNPLQILLFYHFFNKIILLDNQLNLISSYNVPLNTKLISNAGDGKIWIYNDIKGTLSIYNLFSKKTEITSNPLFYSILKLKGNLNNALAITNQKELLTFNYVVNKTEVVKEEGVLFPISLQNYYVIKKNQLIFKRNVILKNLSNITSFEVVNNTFYFFKQNKIYSTSISKN